MSPTTALNMMATGRDVLAPSLAPVIKISSANLERVMRSMAVDELSLSTKSIIRETSQITAVADASVLVYVSSGEGWLDDGRSGLVRLEPHTLIILPPRDDRRDKVEGLRIEALAAMAKCSSVLRNSASGSFQSSITPANEIGINLFYGVFRASYDGCADVFSTLSTPMIEQFCQGDGIDGKLTAALNELNSDRVGCAAMARAGLKQILISALRRALESTGCWVEDFAMLGNPRIARALIAMRENPDVDYTVAGLARVAGLSRSSFMAQFKQQIGKPPMSVLRDIRMRKSAALLRAGNATMSDAMREAGYTNKDSFERAFRRAYGCTPAEYRVA
jgi:AraC family transcriptional activator of mtrCDE